MSVEQGNQEDINQMESAILTKVLYSEYYIARADLSRLEQHYGSGFQKALSNLLDAGLLVEGKYDPTNPRKLILAIPFSRVQEARYRSLKLGLRTDWDMLSTIPPLGEVDWKTTVTISPEGDGKIEHDVSGVVSWGELRSTEMSAYSDFDFTLEDIELKASAPGSQRSVRLEPLLSSGKYFSYRLVFDPPFEPGQAFRYHCSYRLPKVFLKTLQAGSLDWYEHKMFHSETRYELTIIFPDDVKIDIDFAESNIRTAGGQRFGLKDNAALEEKIEGRKKIVQLSLPKAVAGTKCKAVWRTIAVGERRSGMTMPGAGTG